MLIHKVGFIRRLRNIMGESKEIVNPGLVPRFTPPAYKRMPREAMRAWLKDHFDPAEACHNRDDAKPSCGWMYGTSLHGQTNPKSSAHATWHIQPTRQVRRLGATPIPIWESGYKNILATSHHIY